MIIKDLTSFKNRFEFQQNRFFNIGDKVRHQILGTFDCSITEDLKNGTYKIKGLIKVEDKGNKYVDSYSAIDYWYRIFPLKHTDKKFHKKNKWKEKLNFFTNKKDLDRMIGSFFYEGINTNPPYQRGLVWTDEQKEDLLTAIFRNKPIGEISFLRQDNDYSKETYETLDGKQRLTTIFDFVMGKIKYKDVGYDELSDEDRRNFNNYQIIYSEISCNKGELTDKEKFELFIDINDCGTPMDKKHIDFLKNELEKM